VWAERHKSRDFNLTFTVIHAVQLTHKNLHNQVLVSLLLHKYLRFSLYCFKPATFNVAKLGALEPRFQILVPENYSGFKSNLCVLYCRTTLRTVEVHLER